MSLSEELSIHTVPRYTDILVGRLIEVEHSLPHLLTSQQCELSPLSAVPFATLTWTTAYSVPCAVNMIYMPWYDNMDTHHPAVEAYLATYLPTYHIKKATF